jgi:thioredoxin reductase
MVGTMKHKAKNHCYEAIIIGAGIGGISAGIYASRKRMDYLILTEDIGGQMYSSGDILNYPGVCKTTGVEFLEIFREQIEFNKLNIKENETVVEIKKLKNKLRIKTKKKTYYSYTVIIASGSKPRRLNVPGEQKLARKGVTYCAVCDGPLFYGKDVAIIGGGNSALEAADFMKKIARRIYLVTINSNLEGHEYLIENISGSKKIEIITNASCKDISGDDFVTGIKYVQQGIEKELPVQAVIIEIGRIPNIDFIKNVLDLDEHNHIKVDRWCRCIIDGKPSDSIYAVGDCTDVHEYQYVISAGMGVTALLKAARSLAKIRK